MIVVDASVVVDLLPIEVSSALRDAASVARARVFGCPRITHDRRLAGAASGHCAVEVPGVSA